MNNDIKGTTKEVDYTRNVKTFGDAAMTVVVIAAASILFGMVAFIGFGRNEVVECNQWQSQAQQYPSFYLVAWQKAQCDAHGIIINAPVK